MLNLEIVVEESTVLREEKLSFISFMVIEPSRRLLPLSHKFSSLLRSELGVDDEHLLETRPPRVSKDRAACIIEGVLDPRRMKRLRLLEDCNESSLGMFILISLARSNFTLEDIETTLSFACMLHLSRMLEWLCAFVIVIVLRLVG